MARSLRHKQWSEEDIELIYLNRRLRDCKSKSKSSSGSGGGGFNIICEGCIAQMLGLWYAYQKIRLPASEFASMLTPERLAELRHTHAADMAAIERETLEAMGGHDPPSLDCHLLRLWTGILPDHDDDPSLLRAKLMFVMRGSKYGLYDLVDGPKLKEWLQAMEQLQKRRVHELEQLEALRRRSNRSANSGSGSGSGSSSITSRSKTWSSCRCRYQDMGSLTPRGFWDFVKPRLHVSIGNAIESHYFANNNAHPVCAADVYITMAYAPLQADLEKMARTHRAELAVRDRLSMEMRLVEEAFRELGRGSGSASVVEASAGGSSSSSSSGGSSNASKKSWVSAEDAEREAVRLAYERDSYGLGPLARAYTARQAARDAFARSGVPDIAMSALARAAACRRPQTPSAFPLLLPTQHRPLHTSSSSTSPPPRPPTAYSQTTSNLLIGAHTRVLYQGFTGRQATANAAASIAWGTNVVGGVSPGRSGTHETLGLPVLGSVREAAAALRPDATAIFVAADQTAAAIEEAVQAEIGLVVAVAEHVPLRDMLRVHDVLRTQSRTRLVGANSPGIVAPRGRCRVGFQPLGVFSPGKVGIAAKSGTLSYEVAASTTRAGLGQSLCVGVGGDVLAGTDMCEALGVLLRDDATEAVALVGELGGVGELEAAELIREYRRSGGRKPIVALLAGLGVESERVIGHAGAFWEKRTELARTKQRALEDIGVSLVTHPSEMGEVIKRKLQNDSKHMSDQDQQSRGEFLWTGFDADKGAVTQGQIDPAMVANRLEHSLQRNDISYQWDSSTSCHGITIDVDRSDRRLVAMVEKPGVRTRPVGVRHSSSIHDDDNAVALLTQELGDLRPSSSQKGGSLAPMPAQDTTQRLVRAMTELMHDPFLNTFRATLHIDQHALNNTGELLVRGYSLKPVPVVPAAPNSRCQIRDPVEAEAATHGITHFSLPTEPHQRRCIGVLSNGAGLAMNMIDALHAELGRRRVAAGGRGAEEDVAVANFLDTGGKATSETISRCLGWILRDERVRVVFVNIFGGIIRGDVIAEGLIMALKEMRQGGAVCGQGTGRAAVPLVVRIRGTREKEGQALLAESGLDGVYVFDDFHRAADMAVELAKDARIDDSKL
ncbi:hypothetical protein MCOR14_007792 [Pyricularia oryzae]|nr:hypothetical protein MCOR34_004678 [Pyricularia oryzae]KAI6468860.1 hypothetical protein MCOR17_003963 [Pyricularia oryzae]KAI6510917.1 hypothetical protein MCOR13_000841 [Pyricularia oryzae]KAI6596650.1 hypothetical protein MCOR04_002902 [Pyricularia oryzae]KAI6631520.1 hypothetical protein MCOR14_007792 [Pyricularia oryzae]